MSSELCNAARNQSKKTQTYPLLIDAVAETPLKINFDQNHKQSEAYCWIYIYNKKVRTRSRDPEHVQPHKYMDDLRASNAL